LIKRSSSELPAESAITEGVFVEPVEFCQTIATLEKWEPLSESDYEKLCIKLLTQALSVKKEALRRWDALQPTNKTPRRYKRQLAAIVALKHSELALRVLGMDVPFIQLIAEKHMEPIDFCRTIAKLEQWEPLDEADYKKLCLRVLARALGVDQKSLTKWDTLRPIDKTPSRYKRQLATIAALKQGERTLQELGVDSQCIEDMYQEFVKVAE
jgi:hypothetical protein